MDRRVLKAQMADDNTPRTTVSFYKYFKIQNPEGFRDDFYQKAQSLGVLGRVYIAAEGINAQVSVPTENFNRFKSFLFSIPALDQVRLNTAVADDSHSFYMLKVKLRKKIVADGLDDESFNPADTGEYLSAQAFNELTDDPNTILVDMRNHYESEVGHFANALTPDVDTFRQSLPLVKELLAEKHNKKILLYCTGGIRCEKASAYFKHHGYEDVNQLEGGIIDYVRQVQELGLENKFIGKNFVFDDRLGERVTTEIIAKCHQCGNPCDTHTNCANDDCHLLFIQCTDCKEKMNGCCTENCKEIVSLPIEKQRALRKGKVKNDAHAVFKSRLRPKLKLE